MLDLIAEVESLNIPLTPEPEASAEDAGLKYVSDESTGIRRKKWGRGITYIDAEGEHVREKTVRLRCKQLAIPPAWTEVWICDADHGHIQATGRDDAGRKQYIYHPGWEAVRTRTKFDRLIPLGGALPRLRGRCRTDLRRKGLPREKVLALVVRLLESTLIRIGNDEYADENESFGLTTMRDRHVTFDSDGCIFEFTGKSGQHQFVRVDDTALTQVVRDCRDLPGYEVFQFFDESGNRHDVKSRHVNSYLTEATGLALTAKDFRPWGATLLAAQHLIKSGAPADDADARVLETVDRVAGKLGNTRAICRDYYIHPDVTKGYRDGSLLDTWERLREVTPAPKLDPDEHRMLHFLAEKYKAR